MRRPVASIGMLTLAIAFLSFQISGGAPTDAAAPPARSIVAGDGETLTGTWLFEDAQQGTYNGLSYVPQSQVNIAGDTFSISKVLDVAADLKGSFELDEAATPKTVDLRLEEFDLSEVWGHPRKWAAGLHRGIYKLEGDRLSVCFNPQSDGPRPSSFEHARDRITMVLRKAPRSFERFPETVKVEVASEDEKPVEGAVVTRFMNWSVSRKPDDSKPKWEYYPSIKTDRNGIAEIKYDELGGKMAVARDVQRGKMAIAAGAPAVLANGSIHLTLQPECHVTGKLECAQLKELGKPLDWTNVYLTQNGIRVAACSSDDGDYQFVVPPGNYELDAYGYCLKSKYVSISVPTGRTECTIDPISLTASNLVLLEGQPAPELAGVLGWKGKKTTLAELRGKYVLLEFWGYWCGPCVGSMPILIDLHEKFADKGLAIVGVHVDNEGDVETAAQLDEKCATHKEKLWKGRDLPFPVALTTRKEVEGQASKPATAADQYGILGYPTTILIDREGNVVGRFDEARSAEDAPKTIQKLLDKTE